MKLPPDGPVCGGCGSGQSGESRRPSRSRRDGGYCSALRPIVSLPRGSRRSRAREPGSSPERHLLPLLWKRPPRLPGRLARDPASAPPAPPASRATANRRRCGRGRRHLGAPGRPFPAARARRSRVPAARTGARPGQQVAGAVPPHPLQEKAPLSPGRPGRESLGRTGDLGVPARKRQA